MRRMAWSYGDSLLVVVATQAQANTATIPFFPNMLIGLWCRKTRNTGLKLQLQFIRPCERKVWHNYVYG